MFFLVLLGHPSSQLADGHPRISRFSLSRRYVKDLAFSIALEPARLSNRDAFTFGDLSSNLAAM